MSRFILRVVQPVDEAAPRAAMRCYHACSGAHNLAIAARLASRDALPGSTMLAASTGCGGRSARKLARLSAGSDSPRAFSVRPADAQRGTKGNEKNKSAKTVFKPHANDRAAFNTIVALPDQLGGP